MSPFPFRRAYLLGFFALSQFALSSDRSCLEEGYSARSAQLASEIILSTVQTTWRSRQLSAGLIELPSRMITTASETLDAGADLSSPVSLQYFNRARFKFDAKIDKVPVELNRLSTPAAGDPRDHPGERSSSASSSAHGTKRSSPPSASLTTSFARNGPPPAAGSATLSTANIHFCVPELRPEGLSPIRVPFHAARPQACSSRVPGGCRV
jgi:hypothetical protein